MFPQFLSSYAPCGGYWEQPKLRLWVTMQYFRTSDIVSQLLVPPMPLKARLSLQYFWGHEQRSLTYFYLCGQSKTVVARAAAARTVVALVVMAALVAALWGEAGCGSGLSEQPLRRGTGLVGRFCWQAKTGGGIMLECLVLCFDGAIAADAAKTRLRGEDLGDLEQRWRLLSAWLKVGTVFPFP